MRQTRHPTAAVVWRPMRFAFAMLSQRARRDRRLIAFLSACALFAALFGVATWLVVSLAGIPKEDQAIIVSLTSGVGAALGAMFGQPLFGAWLQHRLEGPVPSELTTAELRQRVVSLREEVLDRRIRGVRSQREEMLSGGELVDLEVPSDADVQIDEAGRPRIRRDGPPRPWSEIVGAWTASKGRMVVLGDPGYGKTVAALTLVEHINCDAGDVVAEIFPLAEWHAWSAGREEDVYLEDWIAERVSQTYDVPLVVSKALVARGWLVPVLDGLDEVAKSARADCVDAISAYAGSGDSSRSFAVTCRQSEYVDLDPHWVGADRHVVLVGLEPAQIVAVLQRQPAAAGRWQPVLEAIRNGNQAVIDFLRSPLRFGAAMQIYRHRDEAREVLQLAERPDGQAVLWDRLLAQARPPARATPVKVRGWLAFLAASLKSHDRQQFHLHELYLYGAPSDRRLFDRLVASLVGAPIALYALGNGVQAADAWFAPGIAVFWLLFGLNHGEPFKQPVVTRAPLRSYVAELPGSLLAAVVIGVAVGVLVMIGGGVIAAVEAATGDSEPLIDGLGRTIPTALIVAGAVAFISFPMFLAEAGRSFVTTEPPKHLRKRDADAVLSAVGRHAIMSLIVLGATGAATMAVINPTVGLPYEVLPWLVIPVAVTIAWDEGLSAWLFFHWTRWRLARRGFLPFRLQEFLEWASSPQVGWLRFGDGYEFRHRELLDHLAAEGEAVGAGNRSLAEVAATRAGAGGPQARRGDRLLANGDFQGALKAYSDAAAQSPLRAAYARKRALPLDKLGRHKAQLAAAQHAAQLDPGDAVNHIAVGVAYDRLRKNEASLDAFDRAAVLAPNNALVHRNRSIALGKLERWAEQLEAIDRTIALEPKNDAELHRMRASALSKLRRQTNILRP